MANKWLIPVDGSEYSLRAVKWALAQSGQYTQPLELHLLNVQPKLPADISRFISKDQVSDFLRDEGNACLAETLALVKAAGVPVTPHVSVGESVEVVNHFVDQLGCSHVVIGTHGRRGFVGAVLGSFAQKVVHEAKVPVTLIR